MNKPKQYSLPEVFNNTLMGFVFEFYSSKDTDFIIKNLSSLTTKNIILTNKDNYLSTSYQAILIKEYEGKRPRYSFKLGQQRYDTVIPLMKSVLEWISETSECTTDTLMRVNMSFDHKHLDTLETISKMNTQKLILKLDEEYIYERFPMQEDSPYCMSIKQLLPITETIYALDLIKNVNYIIGTPKKNYYGINFENYTKGILEFNYIGGDDYAEKGKEILEILQYYVIKTFKSLNENEYSKSEILELKQLTEEFYKIQEAYYEIEKFNELFPEIKVGVDMRRDSQMLKSFWPKIRNTLFEMVVNNNLREGQFNYDTEYGIFQLRKADINCTKIKGFDLVTCNIQGILENCNLISCIVDNSRIYNSRVINGTTISDSYLQNTSIEKRNTIENCFVENDHEMLNCNIKESIIKFAGIGKSAKLDEGTVIIDNDQRTQQPTVGVEVEEIRDYVWFKNLLGKKPEGHIFGNEYIKKRYI
jgi:hypothetical protein